MVQKQEHQINKLKKVIKEQAQAIKTLTKELKVKHALIIIIEPFISKVIITILASSPQHTTTHIIPSTATSTAQLKRRKPTDKPHFAVDLSKYNSNLIERTTIEIHQQLTSTL